MTAFYTRAEATARRLIDRFGYVAQLRRKGDPTGPAHNPTAGACTEVDCKLVETEAKVINRPESLIESEDKLGLISTDLSVGFIPTQDDILVIDDLPYHFVYFKPLRPGGATLLYEFQARR